MYPTLNTGDFLLMQKATEPEYGDIIAIYSEEADKILCKRVIGKAGDTIELLNYKVYRNGELLDEPYISRGTWVCEDTKVTVPDGSLYVLGDNRYISLDSEELGCLHISDVKGVMIANLTLLFGFRASNFRVIILAIIVIVAIIPIPKKEDEKSIKA